MFTGYGGAWGGGGGHHNHGGGYGNLWFLFSIISLRNFIAFPIDKIYFK